jgi:peptidoglycan/LPS O-acetylase OafA/YrhL
MREHRNNIGVLRLLLASCVIIGHAPEILDGDRHREPLSIIFNTLSLGDVAVDAFFALSGYLITNSLVRSENIKMYFLNRIARIYPAFLVCFFFCAFILAPLVGGHPFENLGGTIFNAITLHPPPQYRGELSGLPQPVINGAMWSISYEFRCYLFIGALFLLGLLSKKWIILCAALACTILLCFSASDLIPVTYDLWVPKGDWAFGTPRLDIRLLAMFLAGVCVFLFKTEFYRYVNEYVAFACSVLMAVALCFKELADFGIATCGVVVLFWFCFRARIGFLQTINDRWDISYGTYLYGWPAAVVILFFWRRISPLELALVSLFIALCAGSLSWFVLEMHVQRMVKKLSVYR